jgi:hypothetical protein
MPDSALSLALRRADEGWHVFPLSPRDKRPLANCLACRSRDGRPAHPMEHCPCLPAGRYCHGVRAATSDPDRLTRWFHQHPAAAVGAAAGPSHLVLIDIDTHTETPPADPARDLIPGLNLTREAGLPVGWDDPGCYRDGRDALRLLTQLRGGIHPWPTDPARQPVTVDTPSGGRHLWYRAPTGTGPLHQAIHPHGLAWQVDVKAGWSYGLAPGTTTTAGTYHHCGGDPGEPGSMPAWLTREVVRVAGPIPAPTPSARPMRATRRSTDTGPANYVDTVLDRGADEIRALSDGRKMALAALAYKTGGYLTWAGLTEADVIDRLIGAGTATGLTHATAENIARRSIANGQKRPLTPRAR